MKVRASIKTLCDFCRIVKRKGRLYVYCTKSKKVRDPVKLSYVGRLLPNVN